MNVVEKNNKYYRKNIKREMEFWNSQTSLIKENSLNYQKKLNEYSCKFIYDKEEYIENYDWQDYVIDLKLNVNSLLLLGTGIGSKEEKLIQKSGVKEITIIDIADKALKKIKIKFPHLKLNLISSDLNFYEIEKNYYDIIICNAILHHLVNLESLVFQMKEGLKNNGLLLINEFIGENKWIWNEARLKYLNNNVIPKLSHTFFKERGIIANVPLHATTGSPFEAIRSEEIEEILNNQFDQSERVKYVRFGGIFYPILLRSQWRKLNSVEKNKMFEEIISAEEIYQSSESPPVFLFAVFEKKSSAKVPKVVPWLRKQSRERINYTDKMGFKEMLRFLIKNAKIYKYYKKIR